MGLTKLSCNLKANKLSGLTVPVTSTELIKGQMKA